MKKELLLGIKEVVVFEVLMKFVMRFEGFVEEAVEEDCDQIRDYML